MTQPSSPRATTKEKATPDTSPVSTGRWTEQECQQFEAGLKLYGPSTHRYASIAQLIPTRNVVQVRTHAQKHFNKQEALAQVPQPLPAPAFIPRVRRGGRSSPLPAPAANRNDSPACAAEGTGSAQGSSPLPHLAPVSASASASAIEVPSDPTAVALPSVPPLVVERLRRPEGRVVRLTVDTFHLSLMDGGAGAGAAASPTASAAAFLPPPSPSAALSRLALDRGRSPVFLATEGESALPLARRSKRMRQPLNPRGALPHAQSLLAVGGSGEASISPAPSPRTQVPVLPLHFSASPPAAFPSSYTALHVTGVPQLALPGHRHDGVEFPDSEVTPDVLLELQSLETLQAFFADEERAQSSPYTFGESAFALPADGADATDTDMFGATA